MAAKAVALLACTCWLFVSPAGGQRLSQGASDWYMRFHDNFDLVKRHVQRPVIRSFLVSTLVYHRYVTTTVRQTVHNPANVEQTFNFGFVLPRRALISNVTLDRRQNGAIAQVVAAHLRPSPLMTQWINGTDPWASTASLDHSAA